MPRIHAYGEPRTKDSARSEFFWWFLIIAIGFPTQIGWVLTSQGWIDDITLLGISVGLGLLVGLRMAWDCAKRKNKAKTRSRAEHAAQDQEAETVGR